MARRAFGIGAAIGLLGVTPGGGCGCGDEVVAHGDSETEGAGEDVGASDDAPDDASDDDDDDDDGPAGVSECRRPTLAVYEGLRTSCVGCHGDGTNAPIFASLANFERRVAYSLDAVVPGDPEGSLLVAMLQGNAPPPLDQMPPGAVSFAEMSARDETDITLEDVEEWIRTLEPCSVPAPGLSPQYARRVTAEHIHNMLAAQLDLPPDDPSFFPIDDPVFGVLTTAFNSAESAWARWAGLGGPDALRGTKRINTWSPLFIQTLGPTAQAWCGRSIALGKDALFPAAAADASDEASVRHNIEALYLDMLGVVATEDEIESMYRVVYDNYLATEGHDVAMKAVCAAFIRHPLWLTY